MDSKKVGFRASAAAAAALFGRTPRSVIETDWCLDCLSAETETLPNVIKKYVAF